MRERQDTCISRIIYISLLPIFSTLLRNMATLLWSIVGPTSMITIQTLTQTAYEQTNATITDIRVIRKCGQHGMPGLHKTKLGRCSPKRNHAGLIFAFGGYFRPSS